MLDGSTFKHILARFLLAASRFTQTQGIPARRIVHGFSRLDPYWVVYTTTAKGRWIGRSVLDVLSKEYKERSLVYYKCAIDSGATTINGKLVRHETLIKGGDRLENLSHCHEPPVSATPIRIVHEDREREFIVIDKPASLPVHPSGKYYYQSVVEQLKHEFGYEKLFTPNRLDRLTSGLLVIPLSLERAKAVAADFQANVVKKEYLARCSGEFPSEEVTCEEPLFVADRQIGMTIVRADGKPSKTVFQRIRYDAATDTSIVLCKPVTGRTHQIRVHLQFLGHPIANDVTYAEPSIWGPLLGEGGAPALNSRFVSRSGFQLAKADPIVTATNTTKEIEVSSVPDADAGPVQEAATPENQGAATQELVAKLHEWKTAQSLSDELYWPRFRDTVLTAKMAVIENSGRPIAKLPDRRDSFVDDAEPSDMPQYGHEAALTALGVPPRVASTRTPPPDMLLPADGEEGTVEVDGVTLCADCHALIRADPKPEEMCIFLHALRYSMSLGTFETQPPKWAEEGWRWGQLL